MHIYIYIYIYVWAGVSLKENGCVKDPWTFSRGTPVANSKVSCGLIWREQSGHEYLREQSTHGYHREQSTHGYHRGPDGLELISCGAEYNAHAAHTIPPSWSSKSTIQKSHKIESSLQLLDGVGKADRSIMWVIYSALKEVSKCANTNTRENAMCLAGRRAQWCW